MDYEDDIKSEDDEIFSMEEEGGEGVVEEDFGLGEEDPDKDR